MDTPSRKRWLVLLRHSAYGNSLSKAGLDTALAAAAFEQPVNVLFMGDGVLQLLPEQDGERLGVKTLGKQIASLPMYDIELLYVDAAAAQDYALDLEQAPVPVKALDDAGIAELIAGADTLLGF